MTTIEVYKDHKGEHRWRLVARNGRIIADGAEGYTRKAGAQRAARRFLEIIVNETIEIAYG